MEKEIPFQNTALFDVKKKKLNELLEHSSSLKKNSHFIANYLFHGFELNFFAKDKKFAEEILRHLPESWKFKKSEEGGTTLNVFLEDGWNVGWDFEEIPDCFLTNEKELELAIQRDFYGIDDGKEIIICLSGVHGDGIFNSLRWFLPRRMIKKGCFLLHSSCVVNNGEAVFFLGHSGAGKSTVASLSGKRMVLGDDMNVLKIIDGRVFARAGGLGGLSFSGTDFDRDYPVSGFHWLVQDDHNSKLPLVKSVAVSKFLASLANVFWEYLEESEQKSLMELALRVVELGPFFELHFTKTEECWNNVI